MRHLAARLSEIAMGAMLMLGCVRSQPTPSNGDAPPTHDGEKVVEMHDDDRGRWAPDGGEGVLRTHGDASLLGRLSEPLAGGSWSIAAKAPLDAAAGILAVLTSGDRIVVQSGEGWLLFDRELHQQQAGHAARGALVLDPGEGLLWSPDLGGSIRAVQLRDGKEAFLVPSSFGGGFERRLIVRRGRRLIVGGVVSGPESHGDPAGSGAFLEVIDLGSPRAVDISGLLDSAVTLAERRVSTTVFAAAVGADSIVLAEPEGIRRLDLGLEPQGDLVKLASVTALSLDSNGDVHAVSQRDTAWTYVRLHGLREVGRATLAEPFGRRPFPPVVAGDHRAYVVGDDRIGAFDPPARAAGVWTVGDRIVGAMVCADGSLLVGAGSSILAFDRSGKRTVLHDFGRERVLTAPVLDASGRLLVATNAGLYALSRGG